MRSILHASDYHLGAKFTSYPSSYRCLLEDYQKQCFIFLVDYALEQKVDAILFAGDFFDDSWPKAELVRFLQSQLLRLEKAEIPLVLALGNHDVHLDVGQFSSSALKVFSQEEIQSFSFSHWKVYGLSHEKTWDQRRPAELLKKREGGFSLGLFHSVVGKKEAQVYLPLSLEDIQAMDFDYLALGHVHRPLQLSEYPMAYYSGALCSTLEDQGGFYHYRFGERFPVRIPSPPFPITKVTVTLEDLQRDLLMLEERAEKEALYLVLEGLLHPKEKLMLEHWKKSREIPMEDHTYLLMEETLPPLLESCRHHLRHGLAELVNQDYLGWTKDEAKDYFMKRREDLFEELLSLYLGESHD